MNNEDPSLIEVWKWKEEIYNETKDLTAEEYIAKMRQDANTILKEYSLSLQTAETVEHKD